MVNVKRIQEPCEANLGHFFHQNKDILNRDHGKNGTQVLMNNKYMSRFWGSHFSDGQSTTVSSRQQRWVKKSHHHWRRLAGHQKLGGMSRALHTIDGHNEGLQDYIHTSHIGRTLEKDNWTGLMIQIDTDLNGFHSYWWWLTTLIY